MKMNKDKYENLIELFDMISEAFGHVDGFVSSGNYDTAIALLQQCQQSAVAIGTSIEQDFGEGTSTVSCLEKLCEDIYNASLKISGSNEIVSLQALHDSLSNSKSEFVKEFPLEKLIVFLPCSPTLWYGFDHLYKSLKKDAACNVVVVPIPWYEKDPDYSIDEEKCHLDIEGYPEYVDITSYDQINLKELHPDIIYIQNAYEDNNLGGSIHPSYHASRLKELCDELVFIPPYIFEEPDVNNKDQLEKLREYLCFAGFDHVDKIILQSENMKEAIIRLLAGKEESAYRNNLSKKIVGEGHPRVEAVKEQALLKPKDDSTNKKTILFANSIPAMLNDSIGFMDRIEKMLSLAKAHQDELSIIWRPHPLMLEVADQLRPEISNSFRELIEYFNNEKIGTLDTNPDPTPSIALADAYYGDPSSVMELFKLTGKPIMIENPDVF